MSNRQSGTFLSYDKVTQLGRILPEGASEGVELLFHSRDIESDGKKIVKIGAICSFVMAKRQEEAMATQIRYE